MKALEMTLGDRLRLARQRAGLQQSELAGRIGIARMSVSNYETGKRQPSDAVLQAWAAETAVEREWLVQEVAA